MQRRIDRGLDDDILVETADEVVDRVHDPVGDVVDRAGGRRFHRVCRMGERNTYGVLARSFCSAMSASTMRARRSAPSGLWLGASRDGDCTRPGQHRRFGERQVPRRFAEIALRRAFDAVGAGAEIDAVEIELEDLRFAEFVFEPERQHHFLRLARDRALLGQEQILGELLGDGRAALRGAAAQHVGDQRAHDSERVDAVMRVEAAILDGDEGLRHVVGQLAQRHRGAAHVAARGERRAVGAEDQDRGRALGNFERLDRRQVDADPDQNADRADDRPQGENGGPIDQTADAERPLPRVPRRALLLLAGARASSRGGGCRRALSAGRRCGLAGLRENPSPRRRRCACGRVATPCPVPTRVTKARGADGRVRFKAAVTRRRHARP